MPHPPSPICSNNLNRPIRSPGFSVKEAERSPRLACDSSCSGSSCVVRPNCRMHRTQWPPGASAGSSAPQSVHVFATDMRFYLYLRKEQGFVTNSLQKAAFSLGAWDSTFLLISHRSKKITNLLIDLFRPADGVGDLAPQQFSHSATQPMNRDPDGSFIHLEPFGCLLI